MDFLQASKVTVQDNSPDEISPGLRTAQNSLGIIIIVIITTIIIKQYRNNNEWTVCVRWHFFSWLSLIKL